MMFNPFRPGRARIAVPVVLVLLGALLPDVAYAEIRHGAPAVPHPKPAHATALKTRARPVVDQAAKAKVTKPPTVTWPGAAAADLDRGRTVDVGGVPVTATAKATIHTVDHAATLRAGVQGAVFTVETGGKVGVQIGYAGFANAYGGDYGARLHLVRLPACALTTPQIAKCRTRTPVPSTNNTATKQLSTTVAAKAVLATEAGDSSSQGSYAATKLSPSAKWDVSLASGALSWSYPLRNPPVPGGLSPEISLGYSSQTVDGRTSNTNNQGSWIGEGFSYEPGYIERRYKACADDGHEGYGDNCWAFPNGSLQLGTHSGDLVRITDDLWKLSSDDGTKIERLSGGANGDNDGEYWKVTTTDGTQYWFGLNRLPGWSAAKDETNSVWTEPVSGDDANEPCHKDSGWEDSFCNQGWRWNLDYVKDVHGNVISYFYGKETNAYAKLGKDDQVGASYERGGYLKHVDYGQTDGAVYTTPAPARIVFDTAERCLPSGAITCAESQLTADTANSWPDVPFDRGCTPGTKCKRDQAAPTFWTRKRLTAITTQIRGATDWTPVERWGMDQSFTDNGDGSKTLWLGQITHTGLAGGSVSMPATKLIGIQMANRIDTDTDMLAPLNRYRLSTVYTDTGNEIQINYKPADCTAGSLPAEGSSTRRCYPVKWNPFGTPKDLTDWFHKYVVGQVIAVDPTGGNPDQVTTYDYENTGFGGKDPVAGGAWRKSPPDGITKDEDLTWSQWRGYPKVVVRTGDQQTLSTRVEHYFYRGMDGDPKPGGGTRSVQVTDDNGASYTDTDELAGQELETITYNGSAVVTRTINQPLMWTTRTDTQTWGTRRAVMVKPGTQNSYTALSPDAQGQPQWRQTRTVSTYDQTWGRILTQEEQGDVGTAADDKCTRTSYVDNPGAYIYQLPMLTETFSVACSVTPDRRTQLLASERKVYDGKGYGGAPTKGDVTELGSLDSDDGTTTKYLTSKITVNSYGRPTVSIDPAGAETDTAYTFVNGLNTQAKVTNAMGQVTINDIDPAYGLTADTIDTSGRRTDLAYDPLGRLTAVWQPNRSKALGNSPNSKYAYDIRSDKPSVITTQKLANDGSYTTSYQLLDSQLRVRQSQSQGPDGGWLISDEIYNSTGQKATKTDNYLVLGAAGDQLLTVPEGSVNGAHKYLYDGAGRPTDDIFLTAGDERWRTRTTYDGARVTTLPPAGGFASTATMDAGGHTVRLDQYATSTATGTATTTTYAFAANGKIASLTDPARKTWTWAYDQRGNAIKTVDPDAGTSTFTFDGLNRMTSAEDGRHVVTSYVYDKLGRKTSEWQGAANTGTKLAAWVYDTFYPGQLAGTVRYDGAAAYTITYPQRDGLYNPLKTTYTIPAAAGAGLAGTYDISTSYNLDGTIQTLGLPAAGGLPAESVTTTYDRLQRPIALTGLTSYVVSNDTYKTHYDNVGRLLQMTLWDGSGKKAWETFSYDRGTGAETGIRLDREGAAAVDLDAHYRYDDQGNVLSVADTPAGGPVDTQCYSYDGNRRLTEAWSTGTADATQCANGPAATGVGGPAPYHQSWTFDVEGQRTGQTTYPAGTGTPATQDYKYTGGDTRPHTLKSVEQGGVTTTAYTYDEAGALKTRTAGGVTETFSWNADGRLAGYSTGGGTGSTYLYDADGARLLEKTPGATTLHLGATDLRLDTATGAVRGTRFYTFGGLAVATRTTSGVSYTVADSHNTNSCVVNATSGAITWRRTLPYGGTRGAAPASWPDNRSFLGKDNDEGGLVDLGARDYDPSTGRFISVDPVLDISDPSQFNGYGYAGGNPTTTTDPTGTMYDSPGGPPPGPLPPAPPATCSAATPAYCHGNGAGNGSGNRKGNPKTPIDLFKEWVEVEAEGCVTEYVACNTTEYFNDGDPFTDEIKGLKTVDEVRDTVEMMFATGQYEVGREYDLDFHLSLAGAQGRADNAINNAYGIATHGARGEQWALSFLGSYDLKYTIVGKDGNGDPVIEYHLTNSSTLASAAPNPGKVDNYGEDHCAGCGYDAKPGEHYLQQDVRWRETFVGEKRTDHVDSRPGAPWQDPRQRDPLISNRVYDTLEHGREKLKKLFN